MNKKLISGVIIAGVMIVLLSSGAAGYETTKIWDSSGLINDTISTIAIADLNNDGMNEIIAGGSKIYTIKYEDDNYSLQWDSGSMINDSILSLNAADLNRDHKIDIIVGTKNRVYVLKNNGDNNYTINWDSDSVVDDVITSVAVADTDNNGKVEIIVAFVPGFYEKQNDFESKIYVFEEDKNDSYTLINNVLVRGMVRTMSIDDMNYDMKMDIITGVTNTNAMRRNGKVYIFEKTESNQYIKVWDSDNTGEDAIARITTSDTDKDGRKEIIINGWNELYVFENAGNNNYEIIWGVESFTRDISVDKTLINPPCPVIFADPDKDGRIEIIIGNTQGMYIYEDYGSNNYKIVHKPFYNKLYDIKVTDTNKNRKNEIVYTSQGKIEIFEVEPAQSQIDLSIGKDRWGEKELWISEKLWGPPWIDVEVMIKNINSIANAENVTIGLFEDGVLKENQTIDILSDQKAGIRFYWIPSNRTAEKRRVEVRIDPYNQVKEQNETNNGAYRDVDLSKYDSTLEIFGIKPARQEIDLSIEKTTSGEEKLWIGEIHYTPHYILLKKPRIDVRTEVRNKDCMNLENVTIGLFVDGILKEKQIIDVLSNQEVSIGFQWNPSYGISGKHIVEVRIDPYNQITEQNDANNVASNYVNLSIYDTLFYPFKRLIILFLIVVMLILLKKYLYEKIKNKLKGGKQK